MVLAILFALITFDAAQAQSFASRLNPTGNPIGGGPQYSDVNAAVDAHYVVSTKSGLLDALARARAGEVVYVDDAAEIDLTGTLNIRIPGGVTLASGRGRNGSPGALLYSNDIFPENEVSALFTTDGDDVRITGLRLRGPSPDILDQDWNTFGIACGVRARHPGLVVDNNELYAWLKWAVWLYVSDRAHVHHNFFHHSQRNGYGYGVWIGGYGKEEGAYTLVEANIFGFHRHSVASSGHPNSWETRYNVFLENQLYQNVDRHTGSNEQGGMKTLLHTNLFLSEDTQHFSLANPLTGGETRVYDNWFARPSLAKAGNISGVSADLSTNPAVYIYDNHYSGEGMVLPSARIQASVTSGVAPLTVRFDASGSTDPDGLPMSWYRWHFGDGDIYGNMKDGAQVEYTFKEPGVYQVEVMAVNAAGIPGKTMIPITVRPEANRYVLSAWVKDSYVGSLSGFYKKQLLLNGQVVWEADVAGNDGWQHAVVDVSDYVRGEKEVRLAVRLYAQAAVSDPQNQIREIYVFIDDIHIFGGGVKGGNFEGKTGWGFMTARVAPWGSQWVSQETRSGVVAFRLASGPLAPRLAGDWAEIFQMVAIEELPDTRVNQSVVLQPGWNLVSSIVQPANAGLKDVLGPILPLVRQVRDRRDLVFDPATGRDEIDMWSAGEVYKIYVQEATTLTLEGEALLPQAYPLSLVEGSNVVPLLVDHSISIHDAMQSILPDLVMVKDGHGHVYYPGLAINAIQDLKPGGGYVIYVRKATTLTFP